MPLILSVTGTFSPLFSIFIREHGLNFINNKNLVQFRFKFERTAGKEARSHWTRRAWSQTLLGPKFPAKNKISRNGRDLIDYANIMRGAVEMGPHWIRNHGYFFKQMVNTNMFLSQLGFCCVYFVFMATNLEDVSYID